MYKKRKFSKKTTTPLNTINENGSLQIPRTTSANNDEINQGRNVEECASGSEEQIPLSQEPTQRYLSQRSIHGTMTLGRTQSKLNNSRPANSYLELVLMKSGVQLEEGETFVLSCDHITFVNKFRDFFVSSRNYPDYVNKFKSELSEALAPKSNLAQKLLTGCTISAPGEAIVYQSQDSMFVNFLMIDFLRDVALEVLFDKIEEASCGEVKYVTLEHIPLLPLMLAQLRYVTYSHSETIFARIKRIFESASDEAKLDIIANAEIILNAREHDHFAELLIENYSDSRDLFQIRIIQTLTNLCLSTKMQARLRSRIMAFIKNDECENSTFVQLIKFFLKILSEDSDDVVRELVTTLREVFIWRSNSNMSLDKESQLDLFSSIEQGLMRSKRFYVLWQKIISSLAGHQFKSFDFIILLILIHIKEDNSLYIENILRRRLKLEHITVAIFDDIKINYAFILEKHISIMMHILHDFMREKNKIVADFAKTSYSILFKICGAIQKNILKKLLELTCDKSAPALTNSALQLLRTLQRKYPMDVQNWGMLLMPLLDRLNEMSLAQTRLTMELLCSIAFPAPTMDECPTLQDQIEMLVKKQLINRTSFVKKQGVICSVQLIDNMARVEELTLQRSDLNNSYSEINQLPDGRGKIAANCVIRTQSAINHSVETLGLFYDELAKVCAASPKDRANSGFQLDKYFVSWMTENMTYYFQRNFITESQPGTICGIKLESKKSINTLADSTNSEEEALDIAINIAELVLKPPPDAQSSILLLAPLFNLVRVLNLQRYEGSLESINALLGCAIILPSFFDDSNCETIFFDYDEEQQKQILDIHYHCVNWMRVAVCAFSTQREARMREKVLQRLADLIQIEQRIKIMLLRAPQDYAPPICDFINVCESTKLSGKSARGRPAAPTKLSKDRNKETEAVNTTHDETNARPHDITAKMAAVTTGQKNRANKIDFQHLYGPKEIFKQLDSDIMLLLHEELNISYPIEIGKNFGLLEFRFILTDIVNKLDTITRVEIIESDQTLQYVAKPHYFMCDLSKFLIIISNNMEMISVAISDKLAAVNNVFSNADLFTEHFNYLKVCFGLCLRLFAAFFSWTEFTESSRAELLKESLLSLCSSTNCSELQTQTSAYLAAELFNKFKNYENIIVDLKTADQLYQLLCTLRKYSIALETDQSIAKRQAKDIRKLCNTLLRRQWLHYDGTLEKGAQCNIYLDELVKGFLKDSDFERQIEISRVIFEESKYLNAKQNALKTFPNFKKPNFPIIFRGLCEVLITSLSAIVTTNSVNCDDQLIVWEKSCNLLNILLGIVKAVHQPRIYLLFMKHSHLYLKLLLQYGLPDFETHLRENPERISTFMKNLQNVTRYLHTLCCESKAMKNLTIINLIPFIRESLENLVFRVKALLVATKCHEVFWMGNLMNKDINGEVIPTPTTSLFGSNTDANSDEELLPNDDVTIDETVLGVEETTEWNENTTDETISTRGNRSKSSTRSKCF